VFDRGASLYPRENGSSSCGTVTYGRAAQIVVKRLHGEGNSKSAIARSLGMSRTTVRRLIAMDEAPSGDLRPLARALLALAQQILDEQDADAMTGEGNRTTTAGQRIARRPER